MDTKLIKQFGTDILCYRIRTARQKKRMQYEDFDKQLIALSKEEIILHNHNPGWEPLTPPVQRGWKRFFVLRDDVDRSDDAQFFQNILAKINTEKWSYRKDFKKKKRKSGKKIYVVRGHELQKPDEQEFKKLNFTIAEREFFHAEYHYDQWRKGFVIHFAFSEPWRFVLRVRPNLIDKQRKIDSVTEARLAEISNYVCGNHLWRRIARIFKGHYYHEKKDWGMSEEKDPFKNRSLDAAMDLMKKE